MRIVAIAVVVCLVMSPIAYAGDRVASDVEDKRFLAGAWEAISAIPRLLIEVAFRTSTGESPAGDPTIDPPENEAGPMVIIDG